MTLSTSKQTGPDPGERRLVIYGVGWQGYQGLLAIIGDRLPRLTYDRGDVELMKLGFLHERYRALLGRVVSTITEELDLPVMSLGATTLYRQDRDCGLEFDHAYYLANAGRMGRAEQVDLRVDPSPDLGIEIEITAGEIDRLEVAAKLEIPEVWRFDSEALKVFRLGEEGRYVESGASLAFPYLPTKELERRIQEYDLKDDTRWGRSLRGWVRELLLPIYRNLADPE